MIAIAAKRGTHAYARCRCVCGQIKEVNVQDLWKGRNRSCGCLKIESVKRAMTTHGATVNRTAIPEYSIWAAMIQRCTNPNDAAWMNYGGRGIRVCAKWRRSFAAFLADVGRRPAPELTIDRIDNDGDYRPGNVRWADRVTQRHNQRPST